MNINKILNDLYSEKISKVDFALLMYVAGYYVLSRTTPITPLLNQYHIDKITHFIAGHLSVKLSPRKFQRFLPILLAFTKEVIDAYFLNSFFDKYDILFTLLGAVEALYLEYVWRSFTKESELSIQRLKNF